jgi:hypothetical protein
MDIVSVLRSKHPRIACFGYCSISKACAFLEATMMGAIQPGPRITPSQRKIVLLRAKLFDQLRQQYVSDGKSAEEAAALALALVRGTKFLRN